MPRAYVYILGNKGGMLYVGMTNDLERRVYEHKTKAVKGIYKQIFDQSFAFLRGIQSIVGRTRCRETNQGVGQEKEIGADPDNESKVRRL